MKKKIYFASGLFVVLLLVGVGLTKNKTTGSVPPQEPYEEVAVAPDCDEFPDNLNSCTIFKCQFVHPFTGEIMQKEITGLVDGKCNYVEQMPDNGKMECNYTESQRTAAAQFYKDVMAGKSSGASASWDLFSDEQKITNTIDGKKVDNPLQTFMNDGTCIISGYDETGEMDKAKPFTTQIPAKQYLRAGVECTGAFFKIIKNY